MTLTHIFTSSPSTASYDVCSKPTIIPTAEKTIVSAENQFSLALSVSRECCSKYHDQLVERSQSSHYYI